MREEKTKNINKMQTAKLDQNTVIQLYNKKAAYYDIWGKLTEARARKTALDFARIQNGEKVLEVAVGTGLLFEEIVKANATGVNEGIDISLGMLDRAGQKIERLKCKNARLQTGDARKLKFSDNSFDVVMNGYMFDLIPSEEFLPILSEFRRALKPGGRLVLMNMSLPRRFSHSLYEWIYRLTPSTMAGCRGVAMAPFLEKAGFVKIKTQYVAQMGFPSEVIYAEKS